MTLFTDSHRYMYVYHVFTTWQNTWATENNGNSVILWNEFLLYCVWQFAFTWAKYCALESQSKRVHNEMINLDNLITDLYCCVKLLLIKYIYDIIIYLLLRLETLLQLSRVKYQYFAGQNRWLLGFGICANSNHHLTSITWKRLVGCYALYGTLSEKYLLAFTDYHGSSLTFGVQKWNAKWSTKSRKILFKDVIHIGREYWKHPQQWNVLFRISWYYCDVNLLPHIKVIAASLGRHQEPYC